MNDLINNVYLPDFKKRSVRESDAYKLLSENKKDTSVLEGYENHPDAGVVNFESFDKFLGEGGTKEEWIARHATPEVQKEFFSNVSDFLVETGKDTALSLATAVVNGADVATNLMPLFVKALDKAPLLSGMPEGFLNEATEKQVYDFANNLSSNFGEAREYLNEFKKDDNFVSQMIGVLGQDLLYSVPIYNKLRSAGMPRYPAFFISGGIGGAIGIEKEVMGAESTFSQEFFAKDIIELKNLIGILPDTPEDKIADEVIQALEYGAFSTAIPGIIDSFKFMKRYIPAFAGGAAITTMSGDDAEASPFKALVNAVNKVPVFKSAVVDATEKKITKGPGQQVFNTIKNTPGVKESELKWMGLENFLKDKKNVTQEEVLEFINANKLDVNERRFGAADMQQGQAKPLKDFSKDEFRKLEDQIYEDIENGSVRDEYRYVADHINYLKAANFQRLDNFKIKKTEYQEGYDAPDITDQNYNMGSYMNDNTLYRAVDGLDDIDGGPVGFDYWENSFAEYYEVFGIKSKGTNQLIDDALEVQLYKKFAEDQMTLPDEMIRNMDTNTVRGSGFHIQADAFEDFKKYLDDAGAYIFKYNKMEIPKDQRKAVYNETMIRSNEEMYYQNSGDMDTITDALDEYIGAGAARPKYEQYTEAGGEAYSELVFTLSKGGENVGGNFPIETPITKRASTYELDLRTSPHFNVSGEIAHVRFKTRFQKTIGNKKDQILGNYKILSVEEMQSDLVQGTKRFNERAIEDRRGMLIEQETSRQVRQNRFENLSDSEIDEMLKDSPPENLIKDFPFRNNWYELTLKRLIRYAADNGFDAISIPKGSVIQDRYGLTRRIDDFNITYFDEKIEQVGLMARDQNGVTQIDEIYSFNRIKEEFGEDVLDRILKKGPKVDDSDDYQKIKLDKQIEIGGEGKSQLYNKTIPAFLKKYGKKWNAKVYDDNVDTGIQLHSKEKGHYTSSMPVTILEVTPEMKQSVQTTSQPLFELLGGVSLATWGAQAVSDNIENNIISQKTN